MRNLFELSLSVSESDNFIEVEKSWLYMSILSHNTERDRA